MAYTWEFKAKGAPQANALLNVIEKLDKALSNLIQSGDDARASLNSLTKSFRETSRSATELDKSTSRVGNSMLKNSKAAEKIFNSLSRAEKALLKNVNAAEKTFSSFSKAEDAMSNHAKSAARVEESMSKTEEATKKAASSLIFLRDTSIKAAAASEKLKNSTEKSIKSTRDEGNATDDAAKKKDSLFRILTRGAGIWNTWNKAVDFAAKRVRQLVTGVTALFSKVQEVGGGFQRTRATMEVLAKSTDKTGESTRDLIGLTKTLGRTTEFTAQQAADGAVTLLKAGNTASESYDKLGTALEAALATGERIDKVAAIGSHALEVFGQNLGKVGDRAGDYDTAMKVMIASANSADVTVSQLDASLSKGGAIMARLGVPLTRVNAALGLLANKGVKGSQAMRMLSIGTKRLVDGTIPAAKALDTLGVSAVDSEGSLRDIGQIMDDLGAALDLRPQNEQIKLMKDLFGAADKSMGTLLDAGVEGFDELENSIFKSLEVMGQLKEARAEGMIGSFKQFQSALEGVYIELTDVLSVPISQFWQTLADILNIISGRIINVAKDFQQGKGSLQDWIDAIKSGSFKGVFDDLPEELAQHIETLKTLFKGLVDIVVQLFKEGLADAAIEIWDAIFTPDIKGKALELGGQIGDALIKGIMGTTVGKVIGVAMSAQLIASAASAASQISGLLKAAGITGAAGAGGGGTAAGAGLAVSAAGGAAIGVGAAALGGIKVAEMHYSAKAAREETREVQVLVGHLQEMVHLKDALTEKPLLERTDEETAKIQRINQEIALAGEELQGLGAMGPEGDYLANYYAEQVNQAKGELNDLKKAQNDVITSAGEATQPTGQDKPIDWGKEYERQQKFQRFTEQTGAEVSIDEFEASPDFEKFQYVEARKAENEKRAKREAARQARVQQLTGAGLTVDDAEQQIRIDDAMKKAKDSERKGRQEEDPLSAATEDQLKGKQELLGAQEQLISAEKRQQEAIEASNTTLTQMQVEVNNVGAAFEQWLLNPVNVFTQKLLGVREKFSAIFETLSGKKVDLEEKFGLKTPEQAAQQRVQNMKKALAREQDMLEVAQTPEERMAIQERMAGKAEQLADMAEGPEREQYAKEAARYYEQAEDSATEGQQLRMREIEIQEEAARKNIGEYEKLVEQAETAGSRAGFLEQLSEAYKQLGPEFQEQAVTTQDEWKRARAEAAAEEVEYFKRQTEAAEISVELQQRMVDALEGQRSATEEAAVIGVDPGYAEA